MLLLLVMCVTHTWADSTVKGGDVYFDAGGSGWSVNNVQFVIGHSGYSTGYSMSEVTNTLLYYYSSPSWNDASYFAFASGTSSWKAENNQWSNRCGWATKSTTEKGSYTLNSGNAYVFKSNGTGTCDGVESDSPYGWLGNSGYSDLNKTVTIRAKVSTDGGSTYSNANTPGALNTWQKYEFDLSAFEGQEGYVAIRHQSNGSTGYILLIDEFKIVSETAGEEWIYVNNTTSPVTMEGLAAGTTYECQVQGAYEDGNSLWTDLVYFTTTSADAMPAAVNVTDITGTTATVDVVGSQERYNIRYRTAAIQNGVVEDFMGYETGDCPTGWTLIDADGDGQNWYVWNLTLDDGTTQTTFSSNSYINNYGALTPDNWAITPQSTLGATVQFDAWGQDPSYASEHFQVYVSTTGTEIADFTPISEEIVATGVQTTYTFDLGPYAGEEGYIAIRHFNVTDMYVLNVTNFYMAGETPDVPAGEWTVVENVEVPYTIEGLAPNTKYELQVQGIYDAKATTDWSQSVFFTTLADGGMNEFYVVGDFNGWNQTADGGRIELVSEDGAEYTGEVTLEANGEFKIITPAEDGGWIWYGGEDANQVGFFWIDENLLDNPIALMDGSNFRIYEAGTYVITVSEARGLNEPIQMVISKKVTGIDNIAVDSQSNEWYNLNGQKLNGKPVTPGIYINGGKKVIVR